MIVGRVGGRSGHIYLRAAFCDSRQQCPVFSMMGRDGVADRHPFFNYWVAVGHPLVLRMFRARLPLATR